MEIEKIEQGLFMSVDDSKENPIGTVQFPDSMEHSFPYYNQTDGTWEAYCTVKGDFKRYGCGICCAAMITEYKEGSRKDPKVMQERGVWKPSDLNTLWYNASKKFTFGGAEFVDNPEGVYRAFKNQIDKYGDPVVLRLYSRDETFRHFVVAYNYQNSCTCPADIYIRDPYLGYATLGDAKKTWPILKYMMRIC